MERHWSVRWDRRGQDTFVQETLPHPSINLVVEPAGAWVYGVPTARDVRSLTGVGWAIGTKFEPGAFTGLTGIAASSLTNSRMSVADALGAGKPVGAIPDDGDPDATVAAVEALLLSLMPIADPKVELVADIMGSVREAPASVRVEDVAAAHHLTPRTLQRLFRRYVGVGPKWVLKRLRIHRAAEALNGPEPPAWTELALDLGYYDHAHFGNEFRDVVGRSPSAYAAEVTAGRSHRGPLGT